MAIVNETFARKMWGDTPAIGQRFVLRGHLTEVVGVVEDGKYHNMQESPQPVVYLSLSQNEPSDAVFVVRSQRAHERDGGDARTHPERPRAECADHGAELARCAGG